MEAFQFLNNILPGKRILILGFGREGRSTARFLQTYFPGLPFAVADQDARLPDPTSQEVTWESIDWHCGADYLTSTLSADIIIKSPGIPFTAIPGEKNKPWITSQTEWFLMAYHHQVSGITGTKGKSTTSSLLHHINVVSGRHSLLVGNIGTPPLSVIEEITTQTSIVMELSAHQLLNLTISPHIAVLLNIFEEHLDFFQDMETYTYAKLNIARHQAETEIFIHPMIYNASPVIRHDTTFKGRSFQFGFERGEPPMCYKEGNDLHIGLEDHASILPDIFQQTRLPGAHNQLNIMAAVAAACCAGIPASYIIDGVSTFVPLSHRMEFVGTFRGVHYYNDSIATIPQATIQALASIPGVTTLILGGVDRGISYKILLDALPNSEVKHIIYTGAAGRRMYAEWYCEDRASLQWIEATNYKEVIELASTLTPTGKSCLLSPAAASYDWFSNFEERGNAFTFLLKTRDNEPPIPE